MLVSFLSPLTTLSVYFDIRFQAGRCHDLTDDIQGKIVRIFKSHTTFTHIQFLAGQCKSFFQFSFQTFTAVNIHREVGGNLAETLERLANTIRDRLRIKRQVRVYSAQGRLSGYILVALPIVMAIMLYSIAPGYLEEFIKVDEGKYAVAIAVIAQIIGFIIIKRMINIRI